MKNCFDNGFSSTEKEDFKKAVYTDIRTSMSNILNAMEKLEISFQSDLAKEKAHVLSTAPLDLPSVARLWADEGVRKCFDRSREYQLSDSAAHFFNSLARIGVADYIPTTDDIIRVRIQTVGITETKFKVGQISYNMVDVAGQRSERRKWIHQFENVTAVIFVVAISSFDQVLAEDPTINRLKEALKLFQVVCQDRWFIKVSMIVFLNKVDLLAEKLKVSRLRDFNPEYEGKNEPQAVTDHYTHMLTLMGQTDKRQVYVHLTCATDAEKFKFIMLAVTDTVTQNQLRHVGLL